jgi:uncharacterized protein (UPF0333 family)
MASGQTIVENGRVSALFKLILGVIGTLIAAGIIGIFVAMNSLNGSVSEIKGELKAQSAINNLNNEISKDERTDLKRRVSELERERRSRDRDDRREQ